MTDNRHPDLEIYIKNRSPEEIIGWLQQHCEQVEQGAAKGLIHSLTLTIAGQQTEAMLHEKVAGKAWLSLWFKHNITPWDQDLHCAQAAAAELDTQIRCIASGWDDGDDPDEFWKVENGECERIQWRT